MNMPFGFSPLKRLKLIHGYDSFSDSSFSSEQPFEETSTLPFVLSEELFIRFEQDVIVKFVEYCPLVNERIRVFNKRAMEKTRKIRLLKNSSTFITRLFSTRSTRV